MLVRQDSTRKYVLGEWVAELGLVAAGSPGLRALAKPYLAKAQEATGETVSLHERWGDKRKITCVVEGIHEVRQIPVVGTCRPLLLGSSGKAILAFLDARERDKILSTAKWPLRTATGKEISYESLVSDLAQVREDGYSISDEETVQGAAGVSVPIFGPHGVAVACLTVSGPLQRCTRQFLQSHVPTLQALAQHISALIGGSERTSGK
jgi:DNA-binding IclR family transcriptional regulator